MSILVSYLSGIRGGYEMDSLQSDPGLVERVIQNVWKRLGLPAWEAVPQPFPEAEEELPPVPGQDTQSDDSTLNISGGMP